jgi:hypothetical protein
MLKKGANFKWKIVQNTPKMMRAIWNEKKLVASWINNTISTASYQTID